MVLKTQPELYRNLGQDDFKVRNTEKCLCERSSRFFFFLAISPVSPKRLIKTTTLVAYFLTDLKQGSIVMWTDIRTQMSNP